jgi:hypothetical protein
MITLIHEEDNMILCKEILVPSNHNEAVGLKKCISIRIYYLVKRHLFDPNYGMKKVS